MATAVLAITSTAWTTHDPGTETTMGYENTDPTNKVVVVIGTAAPADVRGGSEIGHTIQPKTYRDFNFKTGEKAFLRALSGQATVTAL
jgi:hypothetical protein